MLGLLLSTHAKHWEHLPWRTSACICGRVKSGGGGCRQVMNRWLSKHEKYPLDMTSGCCGSWPSSVGWASTQSLRCLRTRKWQVMSEQWEGSPINEVWRAILWSQDPFLEATGNTERTSTGRLCWKGYSVSNLERVGNKSRTEFFARRKMDFAVKIERMRQISRTGWLLNWEEMVEKEEVRMNVNLEGLWSVEIVTGLRKGLADYYCVIH